MQIFDSSMEFSHSALFFDLSFHKCLSSDSLIQHLICVGSYFNFFEKKSQYVRNHSVAKLFIVKGLKSEWTAWYANWKTKTPLIKQAKQNNDRKSLNLLQSPTMPQHMLYGTGYVIQHVRWLPSKEFFLSSCSGAHPALCSMHIGKLFPVKNCWSIIWQFPATECQD